MGLNEWMALTPDEWHAVAKAYSDNREAKQRDDWNRVRMHAYMMIQSQTKDHLTPSQLLSFPWDKDDTKSDVEIIDKDQAKMRFAKLIKTQQKNEQQGN